MKISIIREYNPNHLEDQIICLNEFDNNDLIGLKKSLLDVSNNKVVILSEQQFVSVSDYKLILELSNRNDGLKELSKNVYRCSLLKSEYQRIIEKIDLFVNQEYDENSYLWLYDMDTPIDFLLSKNCKW